MNPFIFGGIVGLTAGLGAAGYNAIRKDPDKRVNPILIGLGAGLAAGLGRYGYSAVKNSGVLSSAWQKLGNWASRADEALVNIYKGADAEFEQFAAKAANSRFFSKILANADNPNYMEGFRRGLLSRQGLLHGAIAGGVIGGVYGMFDSDTSMFGGAFKGALIGAAAMGAYRAMGLSYTKPFRKIQGLGLGSQTKI